MHHPGVILLTETSACIILPSACIILPSSCHHPSPPAFPVLIHRLYEVLSNCHRPASSCHHPVIILLSQYSLSSSVVPYHPALSSPLALSSLSSSVLSIIDSQRFAWLFMFLIDSHTLSLHFMFFNTVIDFHCVFIDLIRCWSVFTSFHSFFAIRLSWSHWCARSVTISVANLRGRKFFFSWSSWHHPAWAVTGVEDISGRGHHPGIILPLQWADTIILASSWQSELKKSKNSEVQALKPRQLHHPARLGWSS